MPKEDWKVRPFASIVVGTKHAARDLGSQQMCQVPKHMRCSICLFFVLPLYDLRLSLQRKYSILDGANVKECTSVSVPDRVKKERGRERQIIVGCEPVRA